MSLPYYDLEAATTAALNLSQLSMFFVSQNMTEAAQSSSLMAAAILTDLSGILLSSAPPADGGGDVGVHDPVLAALANAFDAANLGAFVDNKDAFLNATATAISEQPPGQDVAAVRAILDRAIVLYAGENPDGSPGLSLLPDSAVEAFYGSLVAQGILPGPQA